MSIVDRGLDELDVAGLVEHLEVRTSTDLGRARIAALVPSVDLDQIQQWLAEVDDVTHWGMQWGELPVIGVEDIRADMRRAAVGGVLDAPTLQRISRTLDVLDNLGARLGEHAAVVPTLARYQPLLCIDPEIRSLLRRAFDATGALSARLWPELGDLREQIAKIQRSVQEVLHKMLFDEAYRDVVQDQFVTLRGDRYVVPIKANADRKALGIVHGVSGSGATLFVEPHAVVALNNDLRIAISSLEAAEKRVYSYLSAEVGYQRDPVCEALDAAASIDVAMARATMARDYEGSRPIVGAKGVIALKNARHPLLVLRGGADVVGNDMRLDSQRPVLVVSGPNAGGKTVALKTLGLCAVLTRLGCYIPADLGSRVDVFHRIDALVGDRQGIDVDTSSYAAQLSTLSTMLKASGGDQLVLVDEIGNGTDPEQGAALAAAILEALRDAGARVLVTTHLAHLKMWAASAQGVEIGGMAFHRGRATFRLQLGHQGESHALEVAARYGIGPSILSRAATILASGAQTLADALTALESERRQAHDLRQEIARDREVVHAQKIALAQERQALDDARAALEARQTTAFTQRVAAAERAIGEVVASLQRSPSHQRVKASRQAIDALAQLAPSTTGSPPATIGDWQVGDRVRLKSGRGGGDVEALGRLLTIRTDRGLRIQIDPADVVIDKTPSVVKPRHTPRASSTHSARSGVLEHAVRRSDNTLDLRGTRVDEVAMALERFLDLALRHGESIIFVLHGHGTGAIKSAVRQQLRALPWVTSSKPATADQGGDAYTVVQLNPSGPVF